jgi:hypothetical protein
MIFNGLDHDRVLSVRRGYLHAACAADPRVGDISIAPNLVGSIDNDDPLAHIIGEDPGRFAKKSRLSHSGRSKKQQRLAFFNHVPDYIDRSEYGPSNPACQADDVASPVPDSGYAVKSTFDSGTVIFRKSADPRCNMGDVVPRDMLVGQIFKGILKARLRVSSKVQHYFEKGRTIRPGLQSFANSWRKDFKHQFKVIRGAFRIQFDISRGGIGRLQFDYT